MHGFRGIIFKFFSRRAQELLLVLTALLIGLLFICTWPQRILFLRQYLPCELSMKWFMSFSSLHTATNIQLAEGYNYLAGIDAEQGKFDQAIAEYNKAIVIGTTSAIPYYSQGSLYVKLGDYDLAIKDFIKVIKMDPKFAPAYNDLGFAYAKQGRLIQSIPFFTKAIRKDPSYAPAYYNQEMVYCLLKEYDKAWVDVHRAEKSGIRDNPGIMSMLKS